MNNNIPIEDRLETLINIYKGASLPRPTDYLANDAKDLFEAQILLETRKDEIAELNKLCDKLNGDLGVAHAANEILRTEQKEWQLTIRNLQDAADDYGKKSIHIDRVREVLYMLQFALEAGKRAFAMPVEVCNMLDGIWEETRNQLLYRPNDDSDLPF